MSKKKKKIKLSSYNPVTPYKDDLSMRQAEVILNQLLSCSECTGGFNKIHFKKPEEEIEWLIDNLPTLPYVVDNYMNFLFSNGLTTGDENIDKTVLDPWLYSQNIKGVTNYSVIMQAIKNSLLYGKCGIRWLDKENGIVTVKNNRYTSIQVKDEFYQGLNKTILYAISTDEDSSIVLGEKQIVIDKENYINTGILTNEDKDILLEFPDNFINLRNDVNRENGISKLMQDKQRLELIANVYQRLNYDIQYDGPGRLLFFLKDNFLTGSEINLDASEIMNNSTIAKQSYSQKIVKELEKLSTDIKNSSSDNTILVPPSFEKFEHIPRVTKATEFLDYITSKEGSIIAQCFGITPELIGLGDVSGNVSMDKIIDNAMTNVVVPMREVLMTQISPMLSRKLGVPKIYFDKYELKDQQDKSGKTYKLALSLSQLIAQIQNPESKLDKTVQTEMESTCLSILDHINKTL